MGKHRVVGVVIGVLHDRHVSGLIGTEALQ